MKRTKTKVGRASVPAPAIVHGFVDDPELKNDRGVTPWEVSCDAPDFSIILEELVSAPSMKVPRGVFVVGKIQRSFDMQGATDIDTLERFARALLATIAAARAAHPELGASRACAFEITPTGRDALRGR